jgi:steroid delta-isomerase-like uncharacterized protein
MVGRVEMEPSRLDENKAIVRRYVEEYQVRGREEVAEELLAADFVHHSGAGWARTTTGRESAMMFVTMLRAAFPDIEAVIHDQLADADMVMTRKTFQGTHRGEFMGIPATGKRVVIDGIDILRVADGQLAEHWVVVDMLGLMQQLGAVPSQGRATD